MILVAVESLGCLHDAIMLVASSGALVVFWSGCEGVVLSELGASRERPDRAGGASGGGALGCSTRDPCERANEHVALFRRQVREYAARPLAPVELGAHR